MIYIPSGIPGIALNLLTWRSRCCCCCRWHAQRNCCYPPPHPPPMPVIHPSLHLPAICLSSHLPSCTRDLPDVALAAHAGNLPAVAFAVCGHGKRDDLPIVALPAHASPTSPSPCTPVICLLRVLAICLFLLLPRMATTCMAICPLLPLPRVPTSFPALLLPHMPEICPSDIALTTHAGDLPAVAFSVHGHRSTEIHPLLPLPRVPATCLTLPSPRACNSTGITLSAQASNRAKDT